MIAPLFWFDKASVVALLLSPLGAVYSFFTLKRMGRKGFKCSVPVICVGNPTLGGAGKTPTAIALCKALQAMGKRPVFLSRGSGGTNKEALIVTNQAASVVGDEPLLLAKHAQVIVSRDRVRGAKLAMTLKPDCIILDDGFQNPHLHKDFSILVIDKSQGIGNGFVFPAGNLRAELEPQMALANVILLVGEGEYMPPPHPKIYKALITADISQLKHKKYIAFCGLAAPQKFRDTLTSNGIEVAYMVRFEDHHKYSEADFTRLKGLSDSLKLPLITTAKDDVKLQASGLDYEVLPIEMKLDEGLTKSLGMIFP
jgi:tetraacyldisaccharide 4'-kinase